MLKCGLNVAGAIIGYLWKRLKEFFCSTGKSEVISVKNVQEPQQNQPQPPRTEPEPLKILENTTPVVILPKWQEKEYGLIKSLIILGNRANIWDLKLLYSWCHLESSIWDDKEKKMYPFSNPITLEGNNFLGIRKSSIWDKTIRNPLDNQLYCYFDDPPEFIGFLDIFLKRNYPDAYKERASYKLFFPLLRQGKYGMFCPLTNYTDNCIKRYEQLPNWSEIIKKIT